VTDGPEPRFWEEPPRRGIAPAVPEEGPREHLRNGLCLIGAAERHALTCDGWDCEEMRELLHAIERRVLLTVAQLETR
jgi:hypothetical protein